MNKTPRGISNTRIIELLDATRLMHFKNPQPNGDEPLPMGEDLLQLVKERLSPRSTERVVVDMADILELEGKQILSVKYDVLQVLLENAQLSLKVASLLPSPTRLAVEVQKFMLTYIPASNGSETLQSLDCFDHRDYLLVFTHEDFDETLKITNNEARHDGRSIQHFYITHKQIGAITGDLMPTSKQT